MNDEIAGRTCPYDQAVIKPGQDVVVCSQCGVGHHKECWEANEGCTTVNCAEGHVPTGVTPPSPLGTPRSAAVGGASPVSGDHTRRQGMRLLLVFSFALPLCFPALPMAKVGYEEQAVLYALAWFLSLSVAALTILRCAELRKAVAANSGRLVVGLAFLGACAIAFGWAIADYGHGGSKLGVSETYLHRLHSPDFLGFNLNPQLAVMRGRPWLFQRPVSGFWIAEPMPGGEHITWRLGLGRFPHPSSTIDSRTIVPLRLDQIKKEYRDEIRQSVPFKVISDEKGQALGVQSSSGVMRIEHLLDKPLPPGKFIVEWRGPDP